MATREEIKEKKLEDQEEYLETIVEIDDLMKENGIDVQSVSFSIDSFTGQATMYMNCFGKTENPIFYVSVFNTKGKVKENNCYHSHLNNTTTPKFSIVSCTISNLKAKNIGRILVWHD